jgi:hypothetical protein
MTVRDLIKELLDYPLDSQVYIGKGMGPAREVVPEVTDRTWIVVKP